MSKKPALKKRFKNYAEEASILNWKVQWTFQKIVFNLPERISQLEKKALWCLEA